MMRPDGIVFGGVVIALIAFAIAGWAGPWLWFVPLAIATVAVTLVLMWRAYLANSLDTAEAHEESGRALRGG